MSGAQWIKVAVFTFMISVSVVVLYFDDLFGGKITSDTQVEWSSCELINYNLEGARSYYYACKEPTRVWFSYREDPYPSPEHLAPGRRETLTRHYFEEASHDFDRRSVVIDDIRSTSQTFYDRGRFEPWDLGSAIEFQRIQEVSKEVSGHGMRYFSFQDDFAISFICLSETDSYTLCQNMAKQFYDEKWQVLRAQNL